MFLTNKVSKSPTILILDSGVGGFTIYQEIFSLLPACNYIYLLDTAGFPYGEKADEFIVCRVVNLIDKIQQSGHYIDVAVIACNTASVIALSALRRKFFFPIVGVVPAIKPAVNLTHNRVIGLLATKATICHAYTRGLIACFAKHCKIETLSASKLVVLAEEKFQGKKISINEIVRILSPWKDLSDPPDTIVLGCTHFPLLYPELRSLQKPGVQFIDSGKAIAKQVSSLIMKREVENSEKQSLIYVTNYNKKTQILQSRLSLAGFNQFGLLKL